MKIYFVERCLYCPNLRKTKKEDDRFECGADTFPHRAILYPERDHIPAWCPLEDAPENNTTNIRLNFKTMKKYVPRIHADKWFDVDNTEEG